MATAQQQIITTTPSKNVARRSKRAPKVTQHFSSPGYIRERPQHRSALTVDATTYSVGYLTRQGVRHQSWFCILDAQPVLVPPPRICQGGLTGLIAFLQKRTSTQQSNGGAGRDGVEETLGGGQGDSHHKKESFQNERHHRELYRTIVHETANSEALNLHMQQSTWEKR